ncbi:MAG: hypothetical protein IJT46_01060 [Bacteroidaceae bacterium]|nr:hypothetical protein [Bacteroidaceae bacterium]
MWYKIDLTKLVVQLLPPILRSKLLVSLLSVVIVPLRYLYEKFCMLKDSANSRLQITGNVVCLEKALNDAFYLNERQIYIETPEEEPPAVFYFSSELQRPNVLFLLSEERGFLLMNKGESVVKLNFIIKVPTFLCTSIDSKEEDKYHWKYLNIIKNIINIYKPAGRTFSIELYDYE